VAPQQGQIKTFDAVATGAFLRAQGERLELSQRAVAKLAKISQQPVGNIEYEQGSVTSKAQM